MNSSPLQLDFRRATLFKGGRIVAGYGSAALFTLGLAHVFETSDNDKFMLTLAGNMALWASVSESGRSRRHGSLILLLMLCPAFILGAASFAWLAGLLRRDGRAAPEFALLLGAIAVGGSRRFGSAGAGIGSQFYIGQIVAWSVGLSVAQFRQLLLAGAGAAAATLLCRALLSEFIPPEAPAPIKPPALSTLTAIEVSLQSGFGALLVLLLDALVGLREPAWAVTACVYVIAGTPDQTLARGRQRIAGTLVGVMLGLAALPLVYRAPWLAWVASAGAMMLYATAMAARYDMACGAFAFTLVVTLAAQGEHSLALLASRAWETLLGASIAMLLSRWMHIGRPASAILGATSSRNDAH